MGRICWFTNLDISKRHEDSPLQGLHAGGYPTYDNYDAIEVARCADIPMDYDGVMGVPITFLDKYNPDQFEIVGISSSSLPSPCRRTPRKEDYATAEGKVVGGTASSSTSVGNGKHKGVLRAHHHQSGSEPPA